MSREEEFYFADFPDSPWFCHGCRVHFGIPVYRGAPAKAIGSPVSEEDVVVYVCPRCHSEQIEHRPLVEESEQEFEASY